MTTTTTAANISLTAVARTKLQEYLAQEPPETAVRLIVEDDGKFGLSLDVKTPEDEAFAADGLTFVIERREAAAVDGIRIDYLNQGAASGFSISGGKAKHAAGVLRTEPTPNPNALKFVLGFSLGKTSRTWTPQDRDRFPPVIAQLFELRGVEAVFELDNFVTITRAPDASWDEIVPRAKEVLAGLEPPKLEAERGPASDKLEDRLEFFIRTDVAPFLQADGGDIELCGYEAGSVKVRLNGACGTCPSSIATLQLGVERRLKEEFPEVQRLELVNPMGGGGHHH